LTSPFFPQISAAISGLNVASLAVPENLYLVFRGTEMGSNGVRLPENSFYPEYPEYQEYQDNAWISDLDVLKIAKARQDLIHQKLDKWIAAAITELTNPTPPDRYAASAADDLRRRHRQALEALSQLIVDGAGNGGRHKQA
jgi:hypothetical protein